MVYIPVDINKALRKECKRRRYSEKTIQTYLFCIHKFLKWSKKDLGHISKKDVRLFLENLSEKERAGNTMNTYHMAIKFFFEQVLEKRMWINIKYSKTPKKLPIALSKEEIKKLFNAIKNKKHRLMVELMYSAGLRVSELLNLRVEDFEFDRGHEFVRGGKGNRDRLFILSEKVKDKVKKLILEERLGRNNLLFNSNRGKRYDVRSVQQFIKKAYRKAKIDKKISCHTLRHTFATHLIENGYDVSAVQSLLGHKSPETTMVYLHMASSNMINIKSPLDNL